MNQEESILYKTVGRKNHFKVPDGYFCDFNNRMIALLPELESGKEKHTPKIIKLRHAHNMQLKIVAAACSLAFILGIGVLSLRQVDYQWHNKILIIILTTTRPLRKWGPHIRLLMQQQIIACLTMRIFMLLSLNIKS